MHLVITFLYLSIYSFLYSEELFVKLIESHPQTQALKTQVQSKYYEAEHEGVYPDPKFGIAFRNYPYRGRLELKDNQVDTPGMTGIEYGISQEIPYPTRLPKTKLLKVYEYQELQVQYELEVNAFISELLKALVEYKTSENVIKLFESYAKLTESIQKTSSNEYLTGKKQLGSISKAHIDKLQAQEFILDWDSKRLASFNKLNYYAINPYPSLESILEFHYIPFLEKLEKTLENHNTLSDIPILKQAELSLKKAQIKKELGELEHSPDFEVFFSYMTRRRPPYMLSNGPVSTLKGNWELMDYNEFRGPLFSFGATVRVPVWSLGKTKDLNLANEFSKKSAEFNLQKLKKYIETETQSTKGELKNLSKRIQFMEETHVQALNQNLISIKSNYQTGKANLSDVLFAQLEILNLKIEIETTKAKRLQTLISLLETYGMFIHSIYKGERK